MTATAFRHTTECACGIPDCDLVRCDGCGQERPDLHGLSVGTPDGVSKELGFCSDACLVVYVRNRWIDPRP